MIDHLLMLTCGWVGGVVSALLIRHALDGRRPLDPALLPSSVPMPIAASLALPPPPSPYAPKPARRSPHTEQLLRVWRAAKQDRPTSWEATTTKTTNATNATNATRKDMSQPQPARAAVDLLPSIAWGQPHGGEGITRTKEVRAQSAAENGHHAQAPRRRSST